MRAIGPEACLYFIAWVLLGNFVLLNLFLAILLDNFSESAPEIEDLMDAETLQFTEYDEQDPISKAMRSVTILGNLSAKKRRKKEAEIVNLI